MKGLAADPSACSLPHKGLTQVHGNHAGAGLRIGLVISRFNDPLTVPLGTSCVDSLVRQGVALSDIHVAWVPGAFEIPVVADALAASGRVDAVICIGAVIRGDTPHFDYVAGEAAAGLTRAQLDTGVPCIFGVLTVDTVEQALERAATSRMDKGGESMDVAIEMANLLRQVGP